MVSLRFLFFVYLFVLFVISTEGCVKREKTRGNFCSAIIIKTKFNSSMRNVLVCRNELPHICDAMRYVCNRNIQIKLMRISACAAQHIVFIQQSQI